MVERYRLLNEPRQAESICLDVLRIDPANHQALVGLLLSLTDQLSRGMAGADAGRIVSEAEKLIPQLPSDYERAYYAGIICERRAKARLEQGGPRSGFVAYEELREAMDWYEKAETVRPEGNDDAILRWNTCGRIIMRNPALRPQPEDEGEQHLE